MKKKLSILVALLLCFAMLAGCASNAEAPADDQTDDTATSDTTSDDGAASGDPIKIGMVAPVTGTSAMVGEYMENGFKLAADEINAEGGILGHPIELVLADEVDNAQSSVTGMQLLISEGDISAIIGSYYSAYAIAALPDVLDAQIPTLVCGSSSGVSKEKNPYAWQAVPWILPRAQLWHPSSSMSWDAATLPSCTPPTRHWLPCRSSWCWPWRSAA